MKELLFFLRHIGLRQLGAAALFLFLPFAPARAQAVDSTVSVELTAEERAWLNAHPEIALYYPDSFEPQLIVNADGSHSGVMVDLVNELNRRMGTDIQLKTCPLEDLVVKAKALDVDGIPNLHPKFADQFGLLKTDSYYQNYPTLFARKDTVLNSPADLDGKTVVLIEGIYFSQQIADEYEGRIRIKKVANALAALHCVEKGEADVFIGISHNSYLLSKYQLYDLAEKYIYLETPLRMIIGIRPDWPELVDILNKGLASFSGADLNRIISKWVNTSSAENDDAIRSTDIEFSPEELRWLSEKHTVRVHLWEHAPFMFIENGEPSGISIDYLRLVEQQTGIQFEWITEPESLATAHTMVMSGEGLDLLPATMKTDYRAAHMLFCNPYLISPIVIFMRNDALFISGISDLEGRVVGAVRDTPLTALIKKTYPGITLREFESADLGIEALSRATIDAFAGTLTVGSYAMRKHQVTNVKVAAPAPMDTRKAAFGIRKDLPELASIIDKVLAATTEEQHAAIESKYVALEYDYGIRPADLIKWGGILGGGTILIILLFISWNRQLTRKVEQRTGEVVKSEERFRATFEQAAVGIAHLSLDGQFIRVNQQLCKMLGYSRDEMLQFGFLDVAFPEDREDDARQRKRLLSGALDVYNREKKYQCKDGHTLWAVVSASLVRDTQGNPQWFAAVISDISERKQARLDLQQERKYTDHLIQTANVMIIGLDMDGMVTNMNPAAEAVTGYSASEMIGRSWLDIIVPRDRFPDVREELEDYMPHEVPKFYDNPILTKSGEERMISWSNSEIIRKDTLVGFTSFGVDITARKEAEQKLRNSEGEFRSLIEQSPISIQVLSPDGRITKVNKAFQELWGISDQDLPDVLGGYNILEDSEAELLGVMSLIQRAFDGEEVVFPVVEYDAQQSLESVKLGHVSANKRWVQTRLYPVKNDSGEITNVIGLEEDMTEHRRAEIQLNEYQKRLRALAAELTLTEEKERRRIATELHDGAAQSLALARLKLASAMKYVSEAEGADKLDDLSLLMKESLQQVRGVLLDLSSPALNEIGLEAALSEWLEEQVGRRHGLQTSFSSSCPDLKLSEDTQAMLFRSSRELLVNSIKHAEAGDVAIRVECVRKNLRIEIEDDGKGFDPDEVLKRPRAEGGFGLFSIRERMADLGGVLEVESSPGHGCRSILSIPMTCCTKGDA